MVRQTRTVGFLGSTERERFWSTEENGFTLPAAGGGEGANTETVEN